MSFPVSKKYIYNCFSSTRTISQCTAIVVQRELAGKLEKLSTGQIIEIIVCMFQVHEKHPALGSNVKTTELII